MQPLATKTLLRASLALGTVKKRIMMWGSPAVPNTRPRDRDTAVTGSAIREPGPMILRPSLWTATALAAMVSRLKPNWPRARSNFSNTNKSFSNSYMEDMMPRLTITLPSRLPVHRHHLIHQNDPGEHEEILS